MSQVPSPTLTGKTTHIEVSAVEGGEETSFGKGRSQQQREVSSSQWWVIIGGLIGGFMAILDIQIMNSSIKVIQGALSMSSDQSSWLMTSYFTAEIVAIPLVGWFTQAFGTGRYALYCIAGFIGASFLCANAWSLDSMLLFRTLQGFCGGALIPISFRLIIELLPDEKRPLGMTMFSVVSTFAPAIGPSLGGWLTSHFSWNMIFYVNVLPGLIAAGLIYQGMLFNKVRWEVIRAGDFIGIISVMLFLGSLEIILEKGGTDYWFQSALICYLTVVALISFVIFIYDQLHCEHPLINLAMFKDTHFSYCMVVFIMLGVAIYGTLFLVPYYLSMVHDYNASQIGSVVIWMGLPQLLVLPFIPKLVKLINLKYMIALGFGVLALSAFMDSQMSINFMGEQMTLSLFIRALGQPFIMVPLSLLATKNVTRKDSASSAIIINVFRSIGGSFGTAMLTTFFITQVHIHSSNIQASIAVGSQGYAHFISQVKAMLMRSAHGGLNGTVGQIASSILTDRITQQAEIMAFNDLFLIMGCLMFGTAVWVFLSNRDFTLFRHIEG
ncbi:DHA2 family efflux MFS transporter permease subunit [uncultured Shewanella sp.]|uniref:DHA2 family efflux MFS transporter permease subunit n=1 Tax=uncultured Shewanella sp. TaxID=173975 RepID=UPI002619F4EE|nr:DHA2 family efflux MFS transporter permease subunit [uncultured Shewanella sp.]